jgi:hypothetical protein
MCQRGRLPSEEITLIFAQGKGAKQMITTAITAEALAMPHHVLEFGLNGGFARHRVNEPDHVPIVHHREKQQSDAHVVFYRLWLDRIEILARVLKTKTRIEAERLALSIPRLPAHPEYLLRAKMASELPFLLAA